MVKKAKEVKAVVAPVDVAAVMAENKKLLATIDAMGAVPTQDANLVRYMSEMDNIKKKARVETDKIQVHEIADHKNISLWTKLGKRIGPLHRDNALKTFQTFFELGIMLSTDRPTLEQIEAYKLTDEFKAADAKFKTSRKIKEKSRKSGMMQKLAEEIAKMSGTTVEAINHILKANEIKPLAAGRENIK